MWLRTDASATKATVIVDAIRPKYHDVPPPSSARWPSAGLNTLPMRPIPTAVPTPVDRIDVGYTCAANAYIVVCTALMRPPVQASIANTPPVACGPIGIIDS